MSLPLIWEGPGSSSPGSVDVGVVHDSVDHGDPARRCTPGGGHDVVPSIGVMTMRVRTVAAADECLTHRPPGHVSGASRPRAWIATVRGGELTVTTQPAMLVDRGCVVSVRVGVDTAEYCGSFGFHAGIRSSVRADLTDRATGRAERQVCDGASRPSSYSKQQRKPWSSASTCASLGSRHI
jgi:hypothetical protein